MRASRAPAGSVCVCAAPRARCRTARGPWTRAATRATSGTTRPAPRAPPARLPSGPPPPRRRIPRVQLEQPRGGVRRRVGRALPGWRPRRPRARRSSRRARCGRARAGRAREPEMLLGALSSPSGAAGDPEDRAVRRVARSGAPERALSDGNDETSVKRHRPAHERAVAVTLALCDVGMDAECMSAALLRDALVAGSVTLEEIEAGLGSNVMRLTHDCVRLRRLPGRVTGSYDDATAEKLRVLSLLPRREGSGGRTRLPRRRVARL